MGTEFMTPVGIRLDLADGSVCMPNEVRLRFEDRRQLFRDRAREVTDPESVNLKPGQSHYVKSRQTAKQKLWLLSGEGWVTTAVTGFGNQYSGIRVTNISDQPIFLPPRTPVEIWVSGNNIPRKPGFVSVGSRRYAG